MVTLNLIFIQDQRSFEGQL